MSRWLSGSVPSRRVAMGLAAIVCTLGFGVVQPRRALAEDPVDGDVLFPPQKPRIPVAVIELGDFEGNRALAEQLARELNNNFYLKPIDSSLAASALREKYEDEDAKFIAEALVSKRSAEDNVASYKFPEAATAADNGLIKLHFTTPTARVASLSAELAFVLGVARLGERKQKEADLAFRLARTVDPAFKPDAIRYLPEVVQAFEAAVKAVPPGKGFIDVRPGPGRVFLDGREVGTAPQTFPNITPGLHVVWIVGPERDTHGIRVVVVPDEKVPAAFEPGLIDQKKKILRARLALKQAPDPTARAAAMQNLAKLLEVKHALLLTEANGKTIVQTWGDEAPGFSALRERKDETPADLLKPLEPPKPTPPPRKPDPPFQPPKVVDTRAWYQKPRYQIAGGVAGAVILGVVVFALSSWDRTTFNSEEAGFDQTGRR